MDRCPKPGGSIGFVPGKTNLHTKLVVAIVVEPDTGNSEPVIRSSTATFWVDATL